MKEMLYGKFPGVFFDKKKLLTLNLTPGKSVYGERLVRQGTIEYREWDPTRSKLAAAIKKGISQVGLKAGCRVLYLGAASGTTPSHVSDIVGSEGMVYCLDFAPRVVRDLYFLCLERENMAPLLADAGKPESYRSRVPDVDFVYQDIAQRDQATIFLKNCRVYLKSGGFGALCVKARSVDVTKKPALIFKEVRAQLEKEMSVVDYRNLEPFEKDHAFFVCKKR